MLMFHVAVLHAVEHAFLELHNAGAAGGVAVDVRNIAGDVHVADRLGDQREDDRDNGRQQRQPAYEYRFHPVSYTHLFA